MTLFNKLYEEHEIERKYYSRGGTAVAVYLHITPTTTIYHIYYLHEQEYYDTFKEFNERIKEIHKEIKSKNKEEN